MGKQASLPAIVTNELRTAGMFAKGKYYKEGYTCAIKIFHFGARHYEKPLTGYGELENIFLGGAYVGVIHYTMG